MHLETTSVLYFFTDNGGFYFAQDNTDFYIWSNIGGIYFSSNHHEELKMKCNILQVIKYNGGKKTWNLIDIPKNDTFP